MDKIETIQTMFTANAEAIRIRDQEWRAWLDKVLDQEELDAAESMHAPPDRSRDRERGSLRNTRGRCVMSHPIALAIGQIEEALGFIVGRNGRRPDDTASAYKAAALALDLLRKHWAALQIHEPLRQEEIR